MPKSNCWEVKGCRKEDCVAHSATVFNGVHGGKNGGRCCWVVAGTRCGGVTQGVYAQKMGGGCNKCDFYLSVRKEEGMNFIIGSVLEKRAQAKAMA